jgi:hypothetical protein
MSDMSRWLRAQGLEKYVDVFEEHEIDTETLPELTEDDFCEMAIPIGPPQRKQLVIGRQPAAGRQRAAARSILVDSKSGIEDQHLAGVFGTAGEANTLLIGC